MHMTEEAALSTKEEEEEEAGKWGVKQLKRFSVSIHHQSEGCRAGSEKRRRTSVDVPSHTGLPFSAPKERDSRAAVRNTGRR